MVFEVVLDVRDENRWMNGGHGLLSESADDMDKGVQAEACNREQDEDRDGSLSRHGLLLVGLKAIKANVFSDDSGRHQTQQRSSFQW